MSNRIIKESICTSEKLASLTLLEFKIWVHLITQVDDMGRGDARPLIIKGRAFPLQEDITQKEISKSMNSLQRKGCIRLYIVDGKPYFDFENWGEHQRIRNSKSKYPSFEEKENTEPFEFQMDYNGADCQKTAGDSAENIDSAANGGNSPQTAAKCGPIQSNPIRIQSESKSESKSESESERENTCALAQVQERTAPCGEFSPAQAPFTRKKATRRGYGEFGWVKLTEGEYAKLCAELGEQEVSRCIRYIDESAQSSQNKNRWKDWNLVVRRCSREGWGKRASSGAAAPKSSNPFLEMLKEETGL